MPPPAEGARYIIRYNASAAARKTLLNVASRTGEAFCAMAHCDYTQIVSPGFTSLGLLTSSACRTSTKPSSTATSVDSWSSTVTSNMVPRTEITAVGVVTRLWFG